MTTDTDIAFMRHALAMAKRHQGLTAENPSVGCVLVKDNIIIGRGTTDIGGRPHAETIALAQAGDQAKNAIAYVTLEPCSHYGQTPPCTDALIKAGIKKVFIGLQDPYPKVDGSGIKKLNATGIETHTGLLQDEISELYQPFITNIIHKRPFYTIKFAASLDGKVNFYPDMDRKKISSDFDHQKAHQLRYRHHAIAVGINTVLSDNCRLNCRLNGLEHYSPDIIIFDSQCRIDPSLPIITKTQKRIFIFHNPTAKPRFTQDNVIYAPIAKDFDKINEFLLAHNIYSVLLEGGPTLHTSCINAGLCDNIIHFTGNMIIGDQAKSAFGELKNIIDLLDQY